MRTAHNLFTFRTERCLNQRPMPALRLLPRRKLPPRRRPPQRADEPISVRSSSSLCECVQRRPKKQIFKPAEETKPAQLRPSLIDEGQLVQRGSQRPPVPRRRPRPAERKSASKSKNPGTTHVEAAQTTLSLRRKNTRPQPARPHGLPVRIFLRSPDFPPKPSSSWAITFTAR